MYELYFAALLCTALTLLLAERRRLIVNSICLEIFVVSFLIGAFLANTGLDWFIRNMEMPCFFVKLVKAKGGVRLKDFDWYWYAT